MNYTEGLWDAIKGLSWSPPVLLLFMLCGLICTIKTGFIQIRAPYIFYKSYLKNKSKKKTTIDFKKLSPWEALSSALAGTVGTGNVAGVTLAIICGGAGAVFWIWLSAFLGMATKYVEIYLSVKHRETMPDGSFRGGPMYYMEKCLGNAGRPLAYSFAFFGAMASFGIGNLAQCREIADAAKGIFSISPAVSGFCLTALTVYIITGGVKRMGKISAVLVPAMSALYIIASIWILADNFEVLPSIMSDIISQAFRPKAMLGGTSGYAFMLAMRQGFARGIFSNEAGLGSSPLAHAAADCSGSNEQAILGIFEVFISSFVFCTLTAFVILLSVNNHAFTSASSGGDIAAAVFDMHLPFGIGSLIIRLSLLFFAFSSLVSWSYYGRCCINYIFGYKDSMERIYVFFFSLCCTFGAIMPSELCWEISDALNGLMALPNLIALVLIQIKEIISKDPIIKSQA